MSLIVVAGTAGSGAETLVERLVARGGLLPAGRVAPWPAGDLRDFEGTYRRSVERYRRAAEIASSSDVPVIITHTPWEVLGVLRPFCVDLGLSCPDQMRAVQADAWMTLGQLASADATLLCSRDLMGSLRAARAISGLQDLSGPALELLAVAYARWATAGELPGPVRHVEDVGRMAEAQLGQLIASV